MSSSAGGDVTSNQTLKSGNARISSSPSWSPSKHTSPHFTVLSADISKRPRPLNADTVTVLSVGSGCFSGLFKGAVLRNFDKILEQRQLLSWWIQQLDISIVRANLHVWLSILANDASAERRKTMQGRSRDRCISCVAKIFMLSVPALIQYSARERFVGLLDWKTALWLSTEQYQVDSYRLGARRSGKATKRVWNQTAVVMNGPADPDIAGRHVVWSPKDLCRIYVTVRRCTVPLTRSMQSTHFNIIPFHTGCSHKFLLSGCLPNIRNAFLNPSIRATFLALQLMLQLMRHSVFFSEPKRLWPETADCQPRWCQSVQQ